jgi:hypothetical protein
MALRYTHPVTVLCIAAALSSTLPVRQRAPVENTPPNACFLILNDASLERLEKSGSTDVKAAEAEAFLDRRIVNNLAAIAPVAMAVIDANEIQVHWQMVRDETDIAHFAKALLRSNSLKADQADMLTTLQAGIDYMSTCEALPVAYRVINYATSYHPIMDAPVTQHLDLQKARNMAMAANVTINVLPVFEISMTREAYVRLLRNMENNVVTPDDDGLFRMAHDHDFATAFQRMVGWHPKQLANQTKQILAAVP